MKWTILGLWVASVFYGHYRGVVRLRWNRLFLDHSVILAPINAFMVIFSKVPTTPYVPVETIPEMKILQENWQVFREEALELARQQQIKAAQKHDDIGFNSFFKYGWKRFYLKWYGARHPSAAELCPRTVAILDSIPCIKAAMFTELPAGGKLNPHRDPYAGSIRYHLGLQTPNDDRCFIRVDGKDYSWRDGEGVIFDETYIHEARNGTETNRIILFCDIERPMKYKWAAAFNRWFSKTVLSAAASPNESGDQTGIINRLTHLHYVVDQKRRAFKAWNKLLYRLTKFSLIGAICVGFYYA